MQNEIEKLSDNPLMIAQSYKPEFIISISKELGKELLRITLEGKVIAPDLESASEAGRVFVDSIRTYIDEIFAKKGDN